MALSAIYWKWKWYEFSEKKNFYDKIKNSIETYHSEFQIHLSDACIIKDSEYDWLLVIWNVFYVLNFKNWSWEIKKNEEWIWKCSGEDMLNIRDPIEQWEYQQILLDSVLDNISTNKNYEIKSLIIFPNDAILTSGLEWYHEEWVSIIKVENIISVLENSHPSWTINESLLENLGLAKIINLEYQQIPNKERDEEFRWALDVDPKLNEIVQAGPWTWKTHFLIHKIVDKLIDPKKKSWKWIIAITFSKPAAEELEQRISNEFKEKAGLLIEINDILWKVWTIHSFCNDLLRKLNYYKKIWYSKIPVIIDDYKISQILKNLGYNPKLWWMIWMVINKHDGNLSSFKSGITYFTWESYECSGELISEIFNSLKLFLIENNYITHDHTLLFTYEMLNNKEYFDEFKKLWYTHILVDEFQDVSHIQFEIIKLLKLKTTLVWDEHQAIYWFRWASNQSFKRAKEAFKDIVEKSLTYNSRSWKKIVDKVNLFLDNYKQLPEGIDTKAYTLNAYKQEEWMFSINMFDSVYSLDNTIVEKIEDLVKNKNIKPNQIAILSRSKIIDETKAIANALNDKWIICNYKPEVLIQEPFVREIFNFLDLIYNPQHIDMWQLSLIEKRLYGQEHITTNIDWKNINWLKEVLQTIADKKLDPKWELNKLLVILTTTVWNISLSSMLLYFYNQIFLEHLNFSEKINLWHYQLLISKLFTICEDVAKWDFAIFSETIQSTEFIEKNRNWVQCMTIHWAKWLQWEYVFLLWMYKWVYPSPRAELVDELNIWYVGISRAKKSLYIPYAKLSKSFKVCELSEEISILNNNENIQVVAIDKELKWNYEWREWFLYVYTEDKKIKKFQVLNEETEKLIKTQIQLFWDKHIESILVDPSIKNNLLEVKRDLEKEINDLKDENIKIRKDLDEKIENQSNKINELLSIITENKKAVENAEEQKRIAEASKEEAENKYNSALEQLKNAQNNGNEDIIQKAKKQLEKANNSKKEAELLAKNRAQVIIDLQEKIDKMINYMDWLKKENTNVKIEAIEQISNAKRAEKEAEKKYAQAIVELQQAQHQWEQSQIKLAEDKLQEAEKMMNDLKQQVEEKDSKVKDLEKQIKDLENKLQGITDEWEWNKVKIFKAGEWEKIRECIIKMIKTANKTVMLIEPYIDATTFELIQNRRIGVKWVIAYEHKKTFLSAAINKNQFLMKELLNKKFDQEWNSIVVRWLYNLHDRFIIIDDIVYQIWTSMNSTLWTKTTTIQKLKINKNDILEAHRNYETE